MSLNSQLPQHENEWTASFYSVRATSKTIGKWRVAIVALQGLVVRQNAGVARGTAEFFSMLHDSFLFLFLWMLTLHRAFETSHHFVIPFLVKPTLCPDGQPRLFAFKLFETCRVR